MTAQADHEANSATRAVAPVAEAEADAVRGGTSGSRTAQGADEPPSGNPKKPLLAAAGIAGMILIAVPLLFLAVDDDEDKKEHVAVSSNSDTLLEEALEAPPAAYGAAEPTPEPSKGEREAEPSKGEREAEPAKEKRAAEPAKEKRTAEPAAVENPQPASRESVVADKREKAAQVPKTNAAEKKSASAENKTATGVKTFRVVSGDTGKCLSAGSGKAGSQLVVWACDGSQKQRWQFANDGTLRINGLCADILNGTRSTEAKIQLWTCNGALGQKFSLNANDELVTRNAGHCLDVWHGKKDGTRVTTWPCNGQPNQSWARQ
ncbi:ricin-type beta-trefoil lectin domain protein [Streptomyces sp. NEAU-W12]|uniref:ricin-type beta-trefoil lectin domain protein n=1 Tax=Streptomyces sp. NEAU-W12 TaxID=2994668 RepID=UPI00224AE5AC|nr:ricin-type beta-trefoil lectin domain protein [Streptomyces sp. NEAU-W12]MCX2928371.1 ricin-type beta-trefoil lectin domain protein [Streptomyces sp. NEAU-W12]